MAMNKKEMAELELAKHEARLHRAMRWTDAIEFDVPVPATFSTETVGFTFNSYNRTISKNWSSSSSHGFYPKDKHNGSQRGIPMFSTKLLALRALRNEVEKQFAETLLKIDDQINSSLQEPDHD